MIDVNQIVDILEQSAIFQLEIKNESRSRPILGGVFGSGGYRISSWFYVSRGLFKVRYFVLHEGSFSVVGTGETQAGALASAREVLTGVDHVRMQSIFAKVLARVQEEIGRRSLALNEAREARRQEIRALSKVKSVPKRRREIFDKSEGKCHYCAAALTLDGKWHIEHMQPKALLGPNDRSNLVASCVPCNTKKRDRTAEEFFASRGAA